MRVVKQMENQQQTTKPAGRYLRIKPFAFLMLLFLVILVTAGLTIFALTFGEEKVVEVKVPVERQEFAQLYDAFDELNTKYYKEVDKEKLVEGAVNGMVDALDDPYSDFMTKKEAQEFSESLSGSFQGIGAEVQDSNGQIMIVSPIKNSPAERAGLLPNDIVVEVDGKNIEGKTTTEAVSLIRGEKGTEVKLLIKRGDAEPMTVTIKRDDIPIETVYGEMLDGGIAHIQITSFSETTSDELVAILDSLKDVKGIVLDMRQNPGGYLEQAYAIANLFLEDGKPIYQIEMRDGKPKVFKAKGPKAYDVPLTVLVDEGSASASEIVAAALQESAGAKVVGVQSFGKGTMQTVEEYKDGSNLKYTQGKWLTPKGNWINEKGVTPDVEAKLPDYATLPYLDTKAEMKQGVVSEQVKAAKQMLAALGYEPGEMTTTFDEAMTSAVYAFQADNGLAQDGIITGDTTKKLMEKLRDKLKKDDTQVKAAVDALK